MKSRVNSWRICPAETWNLRVGKILKVVLLTSGGNGR